MFTISLSFFFLTFNNNKHSITNTDSSPQSYMLHHTHSIVLLLYTTSALLYLLLFPVIPVLSLHTSHVSLCIAAPVISRSGSCAWMLHVRWRLWEETGSHVTLRNSVMSPNTGREQR